MWKRSFIISRIVYFGLQEHRFVTEISRGREIRRYHQITISKHLATCYAQNHQIICHFIFLATILHALSIGSRFISTSVHLTACNQRTICTLKHPVILSNNISRSAADMKTAAGLVSLLIPSIIIYRFDPDSYVSIIGVRRVPCANL